MLLLRLICNIPVFFTQCHEINNTNSTVIDNIVINTEGFCDSLVYGDYSYCDSQILDQNKC